MWSLNLCMHSPVQQTVPYNVQVKSNQAFYDCHKQVIIQELSLNGSHSTSEPIQYSNKFFLLLFWG